MPIFNLFDFHASPTPTPGLALNPGRLPGIYFKTAAHRRLPHAYYLAQMISYMERSMSIFFDLTIVMILFYFIGIK